MCDSYAGEGEYHSSVDAFQDDLSMVLNSSNFSGDHLEAHLSICKIILALS